MDSLIPITTISTLEVVKLVLTSRIMVLMCLCSAISEPYALVQMSIWDTRCSIVWQVRILHSRNNCSTFLHMNEMSKLLIPFFVEFCIFPIFSLNLGNISCLRCSKRFSSSQQSFFSLSTKHENKRLRAMIMLPDGKFAFYACCYNDDATTPTHKNHHSILLFPSRESSPLLSF